MNHAESFTWREGVASVIVLTLLLALLLPGCADNRRSGRRFIGSYHSRGIHSGLVLYSQGNNDFYPGLDSTGARATAPLAGDSRTYGTDSLNGYDVTYRMTVLLRGNYFSPEYMMSASETNPYKDTPSMGQPLTPDHFSYAMLRINQEGTGRRGEWKSTNNAHAAMIADRNLGPDAMARAMSIHTREDDGWRGEVVYNDNHAQFETSAIIQTLYGTHLLASDNLFADDTDIAGKHANDAAMVYQDEWTYVDQK